MGKINRSRAVWTFLIGLGLAVAISLVPGTSDQGRMGRADAAEAKPKGMFVNLINFPPVKPGKNAEFLEWFRWSNEIYAKHKGFISRTLLKSMGTSGAYAAIVEHESKETFMAMHLSKDREEAFKRVEPLLEKKPTPRFYEVVISYGK